MIASLIVPPSKIQEELDNLWNAQENKNKVRASLFNIIFFTKHSSREDYVRKIGFNLIEKFPARIFFISSDPASSENSLKTAVSVMSTEQGEFTITCDLIEISAQGDGEKQVPFILLPHIIPDLPVFLVWAEDPGFDSVLCNELRSFATRLIFDSESTEDLCRFSQAVSKLHVETHSEIADLNWARLENWRDLLTSTFSTPPFFCHPKIQSIYLQAWIASRMKWAPDEKRPALDLSKFYYGFQGRSIEVILKAVKKSDFPPGMILFLELMTTQDEHYLFSKDPGPCSQISLTYSTKTECKLPTKFQFPKGESGQSLIKEICHKGTSEHYKQVLEMISKWNRSASC